MSMRPSLLPLAALLLTAACSRSPPPVHVVSAAATAGTLAGPLREAGIDVPALEEATRDALRRAGFVLRDGPRPHRAELTVVALRLAPPAIAGAPPRVEVTVEIALAPVEPGRDGPLRVGGTGATALHGDPGEASRSALTEAARGAAAELALALAADGKPLEGLLADLGSGDARVREHAARALADRRDPAAVPGLIARLEDPEPRVVHRAVGALAQIGDERAVVPLIDLSRTGDVALTARLARLIGDIGGAEAEGYLLTLEAGHPDARVQTAAREALGDLHARPAPGSTSAGRSVFR
jgi:hypothetical protein